MADIAEIKASVRERGGKGTARRIRMEGRVPGVVYGDKKAPEMVTLEQKDVWMHMRTGHFTSTIYTLNVDGKSIRVIPRDVQLDPVRDFPVHVDFLRLGAGARVTVDVPMHFLNEEKSPGLKRGGVLNIVRHEIELRCEADKIPHRLEADLAEMEIGDSLHISKVPLPEGVELTIKDRDFTIATIVGRMAEEAEKPAAAEGAEAAAAASGAAAEAKEGDKKEAGEGKEGGKK
ncbi:MAG: 50S ribosomal protein L25/general stress protein Ctc [Hyphomicrobiales bacterium]